MVNNADILPSPGPEGLHETSRRSHIRRRPQTTEKWGVSISGEEGMHLHLQGCNFVNFSRGHVGPWSKNFRSPQENLWAHSLFQFKFQNSLTVESFSIYTLINVNWLKAHWKGWSDDRQRTRGKHFKTKYQMECKSAPVYDFATSLYQLKRCHSRHTILFYKINTLTVHSNMNADSVF